MRLDAFDDGRGSFDSKSVMPEVKRTILSMSNRSSKLYRAQASMRQGRDGSFGRETGDMPAKRALSFGWIVIE